MSVDLFVNKARENNQSEAAKLLVDFQLQQIEGKLSDSDARKVWESGALMFARLGDVEAFDRCYAQLRSLYFDKNQPLDSEAQRLIGLQLMRLLADNRTADFHTELELVPQTVASNPAIKYALHLERYLMEGSYHRIKQAAQDAPSDEFKTLVNMMIENTVRDDIAQCIGAAYKRMRLQNLRAKLLLGESADLSALVKDHGWRQDGDYVIFNNNNSSNNNNNEPLSLRNSLMGGGSLDKLDWSSSVPNGDLISKTMLYAAELERIV